MTLDERDYMRLNETPEDRFRLPEPEKDRRVQAIRQKFARALQRSRSAIDTRHRAEMRNESHDKVAWKWLAVLPTLAALAFMLYTVFKT